MNPWPFIIMAVVIGAAVFPLWTAWRHFDLMENDPEYRRWARERGF